MKVTKNSFILIWTLALLASSWLGSATAQNADPVKWITQTKDLGNGEFLISFDAKIEPGWYVYSQTVEEGGPLPTIFDFSEVNDVSLVGKIDGKSEGRRGPHF